MACSSICEKSFILIRMPGLETYLSCRLLFLYLCAIKDCSCVKFVREGAHVISATRMLLRRQRWTHHWKPIRVWVRLNEKLPPCSPTWSLICKKNSPTLCSSRCLNELHPCVQFSEFRLRRTSFHMEQCWASWVYMCECNSVSVCCNFSASVVLHSWVSNKCLYASDCVLLFRTIGAN